MDCEEPLDETFGAWRMSSKSLASMCALLNSTAAFLVAMMMLRGFVEFDANAVNARKGAGIFNKDSL